jgi:hypothetical protein
VGETPSSTSSFPLHFIIHLDHPLVGTTMGTLGELVSMSKYCYSTNFDEKSIGCSTSIG